MISGVGPATGGRFSQGHGICHGTSGNGFALDRRLGDRPLRRGMPRLGACYPILDIA
jgi:hypothetical protein